MPLHKPLVKQILLICVLMFGFSFALVPLYSVFCKLTGINGKTATTATQLKPTEVDSRSIRVEFIARTDSSLPWNFSPEIDRIEVHLGEIKVVNFFVENITNESMTAQAVPSVSPGVGAEHFKKMECFCFTQQRLEAKQRKAMRLQFFVDPALPAQVNTLTLSYTLYRADKAKPVAVR